MSNLFAHLMHLIFYRRPSGRTKLLIISLVILAFTCGLPGGATAQQKKARTAPVVGKRTSSTAGQASGNEYEIPNDPAIVAESQRLEAERTAEQQRIQAALIIKNSPAQTWSKKLWSGFRQTFPFHSQVIALSDAAEDGSRTLIVSEPPPHMTEGGILAAVGDDVLLGHRVEKHRIGYDGWVKDVVVAVRGDEELLRAALSRLNQRLFFTSYKGYTLKLPLSIPKARYDLNLTVTTEEIRQWVIGRGEKFYPVEGGKAETLAGLVNERASGVYISNDRGLVGWWIPQKRNLYECRIAARQFALDSDLIIGAISNRSGILVLGRSRIVPVDVLPPLRVETLTLLAEVQQGQKGTLAQSYERNHLFAGRVDVGQDWAPILLSPELRDTEYGSLLNITDQLLKGWSNHGETTYVHFDYPEERLYPEPPRYPFDASLSELIKARELTYNWNTKGVGYTVEDGDARILALYRSGALPVSYIPEGMGRAITPQVSKVQETGYKYFAEGGDSNLVRVVQYAAMYQIFSAFNVARSTQPMAKDPYPSQRIETLTGELLAKLNRSSDKELDEMTERVTPILLGEMVDEELAQKERKEDEAEKKKISADLRKGGLTPDSAGYKIEFDNRFRAFKDGQARRFELSRKLFLQLGKEEVKKELVAIKQNRAAKNDDEGLRRQTLSAVAAVENLPKNYADEIAQRAEQAKVWIHTPVVVLSRNKSSNYVGGHNLDARVTKVVADKTVPAGELKIDSRGIVVNPADVPRARAMVRSIESQDLMLELARAARENNVAKFYSVQMQMRAELNRAELAAVRPPNAALHLSSPPPPRPPNKPPISTGEPPPAGGSGWGGGERNPLLIVGDARKEDFIRFKSQADGRHAVEYGDANAKEVFGKASLTHEDAVDLAIVAAVRRARNGEPVIVEFEGLPQQKAIATLHTMEIRMGERGQDVQLVGFIRGDGGALMTGATFARRYNVIKGRVEVSDVRVSTSGELLQEVSLTVPAVDPAGSAAKFTSEITFNRRTPRAVIEAVRARVVRAYEGLKTSWSRRLDARRFAADVNEYNRDLARAVKKIKTRTKLRFDVKTKLDFDVDQRHLRDSFISEKGHANGERPPLSATSQSE